MMNKDLFHSLKVPAPAIPHGTYTATKDDAPVIDLSEEKPGTVVGFLVLVTAQTTLNATDYFDVEVWEADDKASATALDATAQKASDVGREGHDVLGLTKDAVLLDAADEAAFPYPRLDGGAAEVGAVYWMSYRGYKPCIQLRLVAGGTGASPNADIVALAVLSSGDTENIKASVVN